MKNIIRLIILIAAVYILYTSKGYSDIGTIFIVYFLAEYFFLIGKKNQQQIINDMGSKYGFLKKIFATGILPIVYGLTHYTMQIVSPDPSNIKPASIVVFLILLVATILYIDISKRQGILTRSVYNGVLIGISITTVLFLVSILNFL